MDVFTSLALDGERPLELQGNLQLPVGKSSFQFIGGNDRESARADCAANARTVVARFGPNRKNGTRRKLQRRQIPRMRGRSAFTARETAARGANDGLFRPAIERNW